MNHQIFRFVLLAILLLLSVRTATAQTRWADSLQRRVVLLEDLVKAGNFEKAQVEAESFRALLNREQLVCPPRALVLISRIYDSNNDQRSAEQFLAEAELDARRERDPASKTALFDALVVEYDRWGLTHEALSAQRLLVNARDSLAAHQQREGLLRLEHALDSLRTLRTAEEIAASGYVRLERRVAFALAGGLLLLFAALVFANTKNNDRWRKRLERKDLELDVIKANLTQQHERALARAETDHAVGPTDLPYWMPGGQKPEAIALLIEPNRQVVLYLKSLLADRFQIETAYTPLEGLQLAASLLPDLIVCDAVLNGKTGIEIARQIKLSEKTNHIPIILLTPKFGNEGKLDALRAGADGWFTRPVLGAEFNSQVQQLLDGRRTQHEHFARFLHLLFTDNRQPLANPFLARAVETIESNLARPEFTAEDAARALQLPKNHFHKKLKWLTGKEPNQLIREMRLEKAKVLLEKRAGTPQAIAEMVGFSSPGTFALAFKEYFGENTLLLQSGTTRIG